MTDAVRPRLRDGEKHHCAAEEREVLCEVDHLDQEQPDCSDTDDRVVTETETESADDQQ